MHSSLVMSKLLGFKDFFPNVIPLTKNEYGLKLGKELLIKTCTHFLSYDRYNAIPTNEDLLKEWFTFNEIKYYNVPFYYYVVKHYNKLKGHTDGKHLNILSVESFLKLFIWLNKEDIPERIETI